MMAEAEVLLLNMATGVSEQQRTSTVFKNIAGSGTIWTPASGKRFRLLGYSISVGADVASATNDNAAIVKDGVAILFRHAFFAPTSSVTTAPGSIQIANIVLPGNGYLSAAADQTLGLAFNGGITAGILYFNAYGTEE